ncbi:LuxR C-terminal-related transcriptional regulator [Streptacidiphilus sp. N1-12]|uniref:LuxR C-terminal-related transcriptional regulator n=2 Tax=Streptacidiphilus alkalitolerans TaxID=3342712 RepID=A0ABV6VIR6_9ACTN
MSTAVPDWNAPWRRAGDLPAEVTGFVGRAEQLASLQQLLGDSRMVTLTGPGGVGKTRIALRALPELRTRYPDGIFLVELSALKDPELLARTVCAVLNLPEQPDRASLDLLTEHLAGRRALLVLDTCEHLVDACAMLASLLLRDCAPLSVLATSRQPLDVPGEHILPVPPLPVVPEGIDGTGAVALFAQRAIAVMPTFALTEANLPQVLALCRRLDGIPLAIELATVRLRALALGELADRLEDRFRLLTGGRRTAVPRHQTLRTTIGWSHELCTPAQRLLWARLSVFAGTFDLAAAEQVCAGGELAMDDVVEQLIALVDKSVVLRLDEGTGARYRLLDSIREYGAEWLAQTGEKEQVQDRHCAWFGARFEELEQAFPTSRQLPVFRALRRDHDNLRAALEFALSRPGGERRALSLAVSSWPYWMAAGLLGEGAVWLDRALARVPEPVLERGWGLARHGYLGVFHGSSARELPYLAEAREIGERLGEDRLTAHAVMFQGLALGFLGDVEQAQARCEDARARLSALGDDFTLTVLDTQVAFICAMSGQAAEAIALCTRGLRAMQSEPQERWVTGYLRVLRALARWVEGDVIGAEADGRAALACAWSLEDSIGAAYCLDLLAWTSSVRGRHRRAALLLGAVARLWEPTGTTLGGVVSLQQEHRRVEQEVHGALGPDLYARRVETGARTRIADIVRMVEQDAETAQPLGAAVPPGGAAEGAGGDGAVAGAGAAAGPGAKALTPREREVAALVSAGLSNRQIAEKLVISKRTADAHVEHILAKLGAASRIEVNSLLGTPRRG